MLSDLFAGWGHHVFFNSPTAIFAYRGLDTPARNGALQVGSHLDSVDPDLVSGRKCCSGDVFHALLDGLLSKLVEPGPLELDHGRHL